MDTLTSPLQPQPRAFPFHAPFSVLSYTLQVTRSLVFLEITLSAFISVPWGHVVFLAATLVSIKLEAVDRKRPP